MCEGRLKFEMLSSARDETADGQTLWCSHSWNSFGISAPFGEGGGGKLSHVGAKFNPQQEIHNFYIFRLNGKSNAFGNKIITSTFPDYR